MNENITVPYGTHALSCEGGKKLNHAKSAPFLLVFTDGKVESKKDAPRGELWCMTSQRMLSVRVGYATMTLKNWTWLVVVEKREAGSFQPNFRLKEGNPPPKWNETIPLNADWTMMLTLAVRANDMHWLEAIIKQEDRRFRIEHKWGARYLVQEHNHQEYWQGVKLSESQINCLVNRGLAGDTESNLIVYPQK